MKFRLPTAREIPPAFLAVGVVTLILQFGGWRDALLYDRTAVASGEWWRLWTGHIIHFGWPHYVADAGLFLILGCLIERAHPLLARHALVFFPLAISAALYAFDPDTLRYGGLSALNLGLLLFYAAHGWRKNWTDWFWPAVLIIYVAELVLEVKVGHGSGGGMIQFDDPSVHVATTAHFAGVACGLAMLVAERVQSRSKAS